MSRGKHAKAGVDPGTPATTAETRAAVESSVAPAPEIIPVCNPDGAQTSDRVDAEALPTEPVETQEPVPQVDEERAPGDTVEDEDRVEYPKRFRVTNNTRMPIQICVVALSLGPSPDSAVVTVPGAREHEAMLADLRVLRELNDFDENAFLVEATHEDEKA